jgi:hypothetical protein
MDCDMILSIAQLVWVPRITKVQIAGSRSQNLREYPPALECHSNKPCCQTASIAGIIDGLANTSSSQKPEDATSKQNQVRRSPFRNVR